MIFVCSASHYANPTYPGTSTGVTAEAGNESGELVVDDDTALSFTGAFIFVCRERSSIAVASLHRRVIGRLSRKILQRNTHKVPVRAGVR